ncbi:MAG: response regulator [Magnetococcus sp. YQC-9]
MILLDIMMPGMDGYEVCRQLKANPSTAHIPVIFITAKSEVEDERKGLELGAVDYITKPISPPIVEIRVRTHLALYDQRLELERIVRKRTAELLATRMEIIHRLGRAAEFRDNETGLHVIRMSHYTRLLAAALNTSEEWTDLVFNASPMHDIGKIGIPDRVLLKPGKLDEEEWGVMMRHPQMGADIIGNHDSDLLKLSREIALTHHEKWNGTGYPRGLKGEEIPLAVSEALAILDKDAGTHFDPQLVPLFHEVLPEALDIKDRYAEGTLHVS